jgi:rRNA maturation endonuclease Nob1
VIAWSYRMCRTCQEVYDEGYRKKTCDFCGTWIGTGDDQADEADQQQRERRRKVRGSYKS